jgi:hypothetical protein
MTHSDAERSEIFVDIRDYLNCFTATVAPPLA